MSAPTEVFDYADRGLRVFPMRGKQPALVGWPDAASSDPGMLDELNWFAGANVGIATGPGSGVVVVDVDPRSGGTASLAALVKGHGPLPPTWVVQTGGGGEHYYFRHPGSAVPNSVSQLGAGLDIRADRGCVVAPPSVHPGTGAEYRWAVHPDDEDLADLPPWLLALIVAAPSRKLVGGTAGPSGRCDAATIKRASAYLAKMPEAVSGDGGHNALLRAACVLVQGFDLAPNVALDLLWSEYSPRCSPAWSEAELLHKVAEAARLPLPEGKDWAYLLRSTAFEESLDWKLSGGKRSAPYSSLHNVLVILSGDPHWQGRIQWDSFRGAVLLDGSPLEEHGYTRVRTRLETDWFKPGVDGRKVGEAVSAVAHEHEVHEVRAFLRGLTWDGTRRLHDWLRRAAGCTDPLAAEMGLRWMIQAVARAMAPGCKADSMLVLVGAQGIGKSTLVRVLAGDDWYRDTGLDLRTKDAYLQLRGAWIYEVGELSGFKTADADKLKNFLTSQTDSFRPPYARLVQDVPRSCVFVGTTNEREFLRDPTGNRRFWPAACTRVDLDWVRSNREQLWAEAVSLFDAGERWYLDRESESILAASNDTYRAEDPWVELIASYAEEIGAPLRMNDVLFVALGLPSTSHGVRESRRAGRILRDLGFEPATRRGVSGTGSKQGKVWVRKSADGSATDSIRSAPADP